VSDRPQGREPEQPPPRAARPEGAPLTRLDPDAPPRPPAAPEPSRPATPAPSGPTSPVGGEPVIDTRRYGWMIGIFGLVLVIAVSIYQFATHGVGTTGVPPGQRLHYFAAPLAPTTLVGDPNLNPPCTPVRHDPRALNVCLLARRAPLVLSFFVAGSHDCERQVDALQALSRRFSPAAVQFAAVGVNASRAATIKLVRSHHWTIPVAYDRDGGVGQLYGVAICPMAELAYRGGIVRDRLIGDQWQTTRALYPRVRALVAASRHRPS
jgi:peroxiredoxin